MMKVLWPWVVHIPLVGPFRRNRFLHNGCPMDFQWNSDIHGIFSHENWQERSGVVENGYGDAKVTASGVVSLGWGEVTGHIAQLRLQHIPNRDALCDMMARVELVCLVVNHGLPTGWPLTTVTGRSHSWWYFSVLHQVHDSCPDPWGYFQFLKRSKDENLLWLPTDAALHEDPKFKAGRSFAPYKCLQHFERVNSTYINIYLKYDWEQRCKLYQTDSIASDVFSVLEVYFDRFAESKEAFFEAYSKAHTKLSELGSKFEPAEGWGSRGNGWVVEVVSCFHVFFWLRKMAKRLGSPFFFWEGVLLVVVEWWKSQP